MMKWILPLFLFLMPGCSTPSAKAPPPKVYATAFFKKDLPRRMYISPPAPIFHSEPQSVVSPRIRQMSSAIQFQLEKKGYEVSTSPSLEAYGGTQIQIDYSTRPSPFRVGEWDHSVEMKVWGNYMKDYYGAVNSNWNDYPSESIDSILLSLTLNALDKFPARVK